MKRQLKEKICWFYERTTCPSFRLYILKHIITLLCTEKVSLHKGLLRIRHRAHPALYYSFIFLYSIKWGSERMFTCYEACWYANYSQLSSFITPCIKILSTDYSFTNINYISYNICCLNAWNYSYA